MTLTEAGSFLIEKRYVTAKEKRLNILLLSDTQKWDCFVPRNEANPGYFFLDRKTIRHCERGTIEAIFWFRISIDEIAWYLAMRVNEFIYFLIEKQYVTAKGEGLNILLLSDTQKWDCFVPRNDGNHGSSLIENEMSLRKRNDWSNLLI